MDSQENFSRYYKENKRFFNCRCMYEEYSKSVSKNFSHVMLWQT